MKKVKIASEASPPPLPPNVGTQPENSAAGKRSCREPETKLRRSFHAVADRPEIATKLYMYW